MNTPITDAAALLFYDAYAMAEVARRLELDRAALIEALEVARGMTLNLVTDAHNKKPWHPDAANNLRNAAKSMQSALSAARANFPTP